MNFDAGHIAIDLRGGVSITSTRPRGFGRVFKGRAPDEVRTLVPLLFAVCGQAQLAASTQALALAEGRDPVHGMDAVVRLEAVREHLMRIAVDWARAAGLAPDVAVLRRIHALVALAKADPSAARAEARNIMAELAAAPEAIARHGLGFMEDAGTVAARLLRTVRAQGWDTLGAASLDCADDEASCLSLVWSNPLVAEARQRHGAGLLLRLLARLAHLVELLGEGDAARAAGPAEGAAGVETARGLLIHRAVIEAGRIAAYEITAPTDVNFASEGPAARSLAALAATGHDGIENPARLLVEAFDPCVAYSLRVQ
jgi:uptake hydrogenase large subunit